MGEFSDQDRGVDLAGTFNAQDVANTLRAYATMGREPGAGLRRELEGRAEALAGTFNAQDVANTLWAYATMGREPGAGLRRALEGRAEALAAQQAEEDQQGLAGSEDTVSHLVVLGQRGGGATV